MKPVYRIKTKRKNRLVLGPALKGDDKDMVKTVFNGMGDKEAIGQTLPVILSRSGSFAPMPEKVPKGKRKPRPVALITRVHPSELSRKHREKLCGAGLVGEARRLFIEEGMTLTEQIEAAKPKVALQQAHEAAERLAERLASGEATPREQRRKRPPVLGLTPGDVAQRAGVTPAEMRRFLRRKKIGKRNGRYEFKEAEADKIARAAKKHYAKGT